MDEKHFDRRVWAILAVLALAIAAAALVGRLTGPGAGAEFPAEGVQAGPYTRVGITFRQPMDPASVQGAFQIAPAVKGQLSWDGNTLWFQPERPLEAGQTYTASIEAGARSLDGRILTRAIAWSFKVRAPWVAYLSPPQGERELWAQPVEGGSPLQITHTGGKVYDFAVARDGERIAFSAANAQGGLDLWVAGRMGENAVRLVNCGKEACSEPAWSPDGMWLAYSRGVGAEVGQAAPAGRLWTVELSTRKTAALYQDANVRGVYPSWSPDGKHLAAYDPVAQAIRIVDVQNGAQSVIQDQEGGPLSWSADGKRLYFTQGAYFGDQSVTSVFALDFGSGAVSEFLNGNGQRLDPGLPVWNPDGSQAAIAYRPGNPNANRQIWLINASGKTSVAVTKEPQYNYAAYQWDPWGSALVFQRFRLQGSQDAPDVLVWDQSSGKTRLLAQGAALPQWLP